jgi:hypothetical protein
LHTPFDVAAKPLEGLREAMERELKSGQHVVYVDEWRKAHHAVVTCVWPRMCGHHEASNTAIDGCNLVYVTSDVTKKDPYGLQIERATSVVHLSMQPAQGRAWCLPEEWTGEVVLTTE